MKVVIVCRYQSGTYVARAPGKGASASCTSDAMAAVLKCATKCKIAPRKNVQTADVQGIQARCRGGDVYEAEWADEGRGQ